MSSIYDFSTSQVGKLKPTLENMLPNSVSDRKGEVAGATPPSLSWSDKFMQILISYKLSPPSEAETNIPSGTRLLRYLLNVDARSFTQCKLIFDTTKSNSSSKFHSDSSQRTLGTILSGYLSPN